MSEPIEPAGAVAEPCAQWAIEVQPRLLPPCVHESIVLTDDLAANAQLKLLLLNAGHSYLAELWLRGGQAAEQPVGQR